MHKADQNLDQPFFMKEGYVGASHVTNFTC